MYRQTQSQSFLTWGWFKQTNHSAYRPITVLAVHVESTRCYNFVRVRLRRATYLLSTCLVYTLKTELHVKLWEMSFDTLIRWVLHSSASFLMLWLGFGLCGLVKCYVGSRCTVLMPVLLAVQWNCQQSVGLPPCSPTPNVTASLKLEGKMFTVNEPSTNRWDETEKWFQFSLSKDMWLEAQTQDDDIKTVSLFFLQILFRDWLSRPG